jgi:hypothetical protein
VNRYITISIFVLLTLFSCKKGEVADIDLGYDYQPLEVGFWVEYEVDSFFFNDFTSTVDTYHYFRREYIESEFEDLNGDINYRLEQSIKLEENAPWVISYIGSYRQTAINLQKVEYDLRFIKLAFPPKLGKSWQGHSFINAINQPSLEYLDRTRFNWLYTYKTVNQPLEIGGFSFENTAEIVQIDEENLFEKKFSKEIYAKNVGLISKEMLILETQAPPSGVTFIERAQKGFIVKYTITNFKQ